jgi:O-antigen/teichoic acid export membrane protein
VLRVTATGARPDVIKAVAWSALEKWGTRVGTLVVFAIVSHYLTAADFGVVALASIVVELLAILVERGVGQAVIQRPELDRPALDAAFWLSAAAGVTLTAVTMAGAPLAGQVFDQPELPGVLRWLSLGFLFACLGSVPTALLQRGFQFKLLAGRRLLGAAAGGTAGVVFAVTGQGVASLVVQALVQGALTLVVGWLAVSWRPGRAVTRTALGEVGRFTVAITGIEVLTFLSRHTDDLLIGAFLGARALGYYTVGYRVLIYATELLTATVSAVALPAFARLQRDPPALRRAFYRATRLSAAVAVPGFAGMAAVATLLVPLVFGDQWRPSIPVMQVLAGVGILQSVTYFDRGALIAVGATRRELVLTLAATAGNVVAFAVAVPFGIVAVAVAFLVRSYLFWPLRIAALRTVLGIDVGTYLRQLATPVAAAAAMALVVLWSAAGAGAGWLELAPPVGLGVIAYVAATALLDRPLFQELTGVATHLLPGLTRRPA